MGNVKLNVWLRDEKCRPFIVRVEGGDWVDIKNCMGELVKHVVVQVNEAHVEVEVPPGCYVVQGHVCEPEVNVYTDKAIAIAGCGADLCVDLIVPTVRTCVIEDLHPFVREAIIAKLPDKDIRITARTILAAGRISPEEATERIERTIEAVKAAKGPGYLIEGYTATARIIKG